MRHLLAILLLTTCISSKAQITLIPDANFEQALINLGFDVVLDGQVITNNIDTITNLEIIALNISDLTGIQDFMALKELYCDNNFFTILDLSNNINIEKVSCGANTLSLINVTQNSKLKLLNVGAGNLTQLNVSNNPLLSWLSCAYLQLTQLDLSQNPLLDSLNCQDNNLTCLNLKNGNSTSMTSLITLNNPSLICIQVDDSAWFTNNWMLIGSKDLQSFFSTNCNYQCIVGIDENASTPFNIYPNPTTGNISINLGKVQSKISATLTNYLGQVIFTKNYPSTDLINLEINGPSGMYFLRLESDGKVITKKIVKK